LHNYAVAGMEFAGSIRIAIANDLISSLFLFSPTLKAPDFEKLGRMLEKVLYNSNKKMVEP